MADPRLLVVVPMKSLDTAKSRLSDSLSAEPRRNLALELFARTIELVTSFGDRIVVLVVSDCPEIEILCKRKPVNLLKQDSDKGLNHAVTMATDWACSQGFARMAVLPSDLPLLLVQDIENIEQFDQGDSHVLLHESQDGGTNCLLASPPDAIPFMFGPHSCEAHQQASIARNIGCTVVRGGNLALDVDTIDDLRDASSRVAWLPDLVMA